MTLTVYLSDIFYVKHTKLSIKIDKIPQSLNNSANLSYDRFSKEISSGLVEIISPPESYYPDLTNLKETFGDSKERVR